MSDKVLAGAKSKTLALELIGIVDKMELPVSVIESSTNGFLVPEEVMKELEASRKQDEKPAPAPKKARRTTKATDASEAEK